MVKPGSSPPLPEGFKEAHDIKNKDLTDAGFVSKEKYLELLKAQRAATLAVLEAVPESDWMTIVMANYLVSADCWGRVAYGRPAFDEPLGQFVAVRRALNKPIAF